MCRAMHAVLDFSAYVLYLCHTIRDNTNLPKPSLPPSCYPPAPSSHCSLHLGRLIRRSVDQPYLPSPSIPVSSFTAKSRSHQAPPSP